MRDLLVADQRRFNEGRSSEIERLIVWRSEDFFTDFSGVLRVMNIEAVRKDNELRFGLPNEQFSLSEP